MNLKRTLIAGFLITALLLCAAAGAVNAAGNSNGNDGTPNGQNDGTPNGNGNDGTPGGGNDGTPGGNQTPQGSNQGTQEPCLTPETNSNCGNGDHGQGNPTVGSGHANCNADQGEVDPACDPTGTPNLGATNTNVPGATNTNVPAATNTNVPAATDTNVPGATNTNVPGATNTNVPAATNTNVPAATNTNVPAATDTNVPATATSTGTASSNLGGGQKLGKQVGVCEVTDLILHIDEGDLFRDYLLSNYMLDYKVNLTESLEYRLSQPDGFACNIVAVGERNGQTDLVLLNEGGGLIRWLTDTPLENEGSPTWRLNGNVVASRTGRLFETTKWGTFVADLGPGVSPVASNYTGELAYMTLDGSLIKNGVDTGQTGYPINYLPNGELLYSTGGTSVYLLHADGSVTEYQATIDAAPDPYVSIFNGLVSVPNTLDIQGLDPESNFVTGVEQDWWAKP